MNDRYKQLATEATTWCEQYAKGTPVAWEWEQKFTELVVMECVNQLTGLMDYTNYDTPTLQSVELKTLRAARTVIREHFGIE